MKKILIKIFTHNLGIKLLCIAMAFALWIYVTSIQNTVAKFPSAINIRTTNVPSGLVAVFDQRTVDIQIMAEPSIWQRLSSDSFSAQVDLGGYKEGTFEIPVSVSTNVPDVKIVSQDPQKILVSLEKISSKELTIAAKIEGNAATGMIVGSVDFTPDKVTVEGPKSKIDPLTEVSALIKLAGETEDFTKKVSLFVADENGQTIKDVTISTQEADANVSIVKGSNIRTVGVKAKIIGQPKNNYFVSNVIVTPSTVDITGNRGSLNEIQYIETKTIDLSGASTKIEKNVGLSLPAGISLFNSENSEAKVVIEISSDEIGKDLTISNLRLTNSGSLKIANLNPAQVSINISGPSSVLNNPDLNQFYVNMDLANKSPDDLGQITFELKKDNFQLPPGITLNSFSPTSITIKTSQ